MESYTFSSLGFLVSTTDSSGSRSGQPFTTRASTLGGDSNLQPLCYEARAVLLLCSGHLNLKSWNKIEWNKENMSAQNKLIF